MTPYEQGYARTLKLAGLTDDLREAYQRLMGYETDAQMLRHAGVGLVGLGLAGSDLQTVQEAMAGEGSQSALQGLRGATGLGLTGHSLYRLGKGLKERYG